MKKWIGFILLWSGLWIYGGLAGAQQPTEDAPPLLVGHITHVEGQLLRYVPEEQDWVATVKDAPFGLDDALYTTRNSRAEIRLPNRILIRLNDRAQIQLIALEEEFTEIDLYSGTARFFHQGSGTMKVYTPFGYVLASPGAVFDLHSREKVTEVQAFQGELEFRPAGSESRYRVEPGRAALVADGKQVFTVRPEADPQWQSWNSARDQAAARYRAYPGESVRYLPPDLDYQAPVLDENGHWEQVPYQGEVYYFWRPVHVVSGWAPFTVGRWTVWYDDPCWIPAEPFGYVTHHYGNWFFIRGYWYWAPPVRVRIRPYPLPLFYIPWAWYPGRVAWIHHGTTIGWIPLAPHEPYYCRRYWGPRAVVVRDPRAVPIQVSRYQHAHLAVAVHRDNFFAVTNYHPVRLPPLKREALVRDFQPLPVLDRPFLTGADPLRRKHHYTAAVIREKPRPASVDRIRLNQARFQEAERARRVPEAAPAGQPPLRGRPEIRPEARPPETGRKKDTPDRFRTPPPAASSGKEGPAPELRPRTGPGSRPEPERVAPPVRVKEREIKKDGPDTFRPVPTQPRSNEGRGRPDSGTLGREIPERKKEPPALREVPRERAPVDSRPAPRERSEIPPPRPLIKEQPVRERVETPERTRDTGPGQRSSGESSPRGKDRSGESGQGSKER
ncbi:MAG: FecR domain-containing protein [Deltaproteobacteria bacterium]|nr:FecR domain-containing protein [Deltaproteobacteria bacterium]